MFRHLVKLVWHRRRHGVLMVLEIFFSFLVVFIVGTLAIHLWSNYQRPLGYRYQDVWSVDIDMKQQSDDYFEPEQVEAFARLIQEARALSHVEAVAGSTATPFEMARRNGSWQVDGKFVDVAFEEVTDDFAKVLGIEPVLGRWFEESDGAQNWRPVVITEDLARALFGSENPLERRVEPISEDREYRVVGVLSDFRLHGELASVQSFMFYRKQVGDTSVRPPRKLLLRVAPGTPVKFEEKLVERLEAVAPEWSFQVRTLAQHRATAFRIYLAPVTAGAVVALFLLLMVALGMSGVLWQNVVQRTHEIGLRRAMGATRWGVVRQMLTELLLLTGLGLVLGTLLVIQVPLVDLIVDLPGSTFAGGLTFSIAAILMLAGVCGLYPSWLASRVPPAEALRCE